MPDRRAKELVQCRTAAEEGHLKKGLALLRSFKDIDFSAYRDATLTRRAVLHTKESLKEYAELLVRDTGNPIHVRVAGRSTGPAPWLMAGGALILGVLAGRMLCGSRR